MQGISRLIGEGHNHANSADDDIDHINNINNSIDDDDDDIITEIGDHPVILADDQSNNHDSSTSCQQNYVEPASDEQQHAADSNEIACNVKAVAHKIKGNIESASPSDFVALHCIHRVHEPLRKINESAYTPVVVSIGPFHHENPSLRAMEECKWIYIRDLLSRIEKLTGLDHLTILEDCVESIKMIEKEARSCYSDKPFIKLITSNKFLEMMVIDGLFIIVLFLKNSPNFSLMHNHDPVFNRISLNGNLVRDMTLLENQLPMFVLDRLFNLPVLRLRTELKHNTPITKLALNYFKRLIARDIEVDFAQYSDYKAKHLLDLLAMAFHPASSAGEMRWEAIPSTTELKFAGVEFKRGSTKGSFLDIKFSGGVLEIPPITIDDGTESLFRNLIAFEQCSNGYVTFFSSYAAFMDDLINSGTDVGFLRKRGIITNLLGSDEDVSNLFNKLCCEVTLGYSIYSEIYNQVNTYCKKRRHVWRATLKRNYFHNPWTTISLIAAILLLFFTLTATVFAILSFSIHKS